MPSIPVRLSDIERATAYLNSISGFQNPEQHAAQWFAEARAEGETEWRERCDALTNMLREKQDAMEVLFDRLTKAGVDCSDLFS